MTTLGEGRYVQKEDLGSFGCLLGIGATTECHLCLDAGYVGKEEVAQCNGFISHIRPRGEEKKEIATNPEFKARRWVVERTHSWFNRFRKLIPRYEKTDCSYLALTSLAAALITLNQVMTIYG